MARKAPRSARPRLSCPKCRAAWGVATVFEHCDVSWPNQRWLGFTCPRCQGFSHVELEPGRVLIGGIDGAPGPSFFPDNGAEVPGLSFDTRLDGIRVAIGSRRWFVQGKR